MGTQRVSCRGFIRLCFQHSVVVFVFFLVLMRLCVLTGNAHLLVTNGVLVKKKNLLPPASLFNSPSSFLKHPHSSSFSFFLAFIDLFVFYSNSPHTIVFFLEFTIPFASQLYCCIYGSFSVRAFFSLFCVFSYRLSSEKASRMISGSQCSSTRCSFALHGSRRASGRAELLH